MTESSKRTLQNSQFTKIFCAVLYLQASTVLEKVSTSFWQCFEYFTGKSMKGIALTNLLKTEAIHFQRPLQLLQTLTLQTLCAEGCQKYKCRICPLLNRGCPRGKGDMLALVMQSYNSFCQWTNAWLYYLWLHYFTSFILRNTNKGIHNRNELMVSSGI